jgi:hypothetical protein
MCLTEVTDAAGETVIFGALGLMLVVVMEKGSDEGRDNKTEIGSES